MADNVQPNDESRRTFLKSLGVTGAATAGLGSLSNTAAAKSTSSTKNSMKKLDLKADDIVPANKYLSLTFLNFATDKIKSMDILIDETPVSSVETLGSDTAFLNVFDLLTNLNLSSQDTVPIKAQGIMQDGTKFVGTDIVNVVDPTNTLGDTTNKVTGTVKSTGLIDDTTGEVTDTVESVGLFSESSSKRQQQMY